MTPGRATPQTPPDSPLPVWDDDPVALAAAISRAVFRTAPVAVLASSSDDDATARSAARRARQWHAPLLLWDRPAHSATAPSRPDTQPWAELARLHSGWILAMDPAARRAAQRHCAATVVSDPADLPDRRAAPRPAVRLTILLERPAPPGMRRAIAAARATVLAAGARIVELHGHDPRTDPAAIAALARWPRSPVIGIGPHLGKPATFAARVATAATGVQLPGGGQVMFPHRRLVALYGNPYDSQLGALGQQDLAGAIRRAAKVASGFHDLSSVPVVPTFEIIATVASAAAGPDGDYSAESSVADLRPWVDAAGKAGMYVILDLQAGRASLLDQAKHYTDLLTLPYVGLAIDPEWKLGPDQYPLQQVGSVDAAQVNRVIDWLSALTARHHRPQKVLVLHQFRVAMLQNEAAIHTHDDNVAVLIHMDGQGSPGAKDATWRQVVAAAPGGVSFGWKNFYVMDTRTLTPAETMARDPRPLMISYQ